jgi:transposase
MSHVLKMEDRLIIQKLLELGWSYRRIEAETGIRRETISKYDLHPLRHQFCPGEVTAKPATLPTDPAFDPIQNRPNCPPTSSGPDAPLLLPATSPIVVRSHRSHSGAAAFDEFIRQQLSCGLTAQRIYQDLVSEQSFTHSYDCVKRYVHQLKQKQPQVFARLHMPAGEEAQVDFGQGAPTRKNGRYSRPWLFKMVLSHSRHSYEEVVWQQDVESFVRCHERAFEAFGGVPRTIRLDNLKSGVLVAHLYEPELNPVYLAFSHHAGFVPLPCLPRRPEHKGKVESGIGYTQENALHGCTFESLEAQNAHLRQWNQTWARTRIHGTTKKQVWAVFCEVERAALKGLPEQPFQYFHVGKRKVHPDGHIEVERAYYSVPHRLIGQMLTVHFNAQWVKAISAGEIVAFHRRAEPGHFQTDRQHLPENKTLSTTQFQARLLTHCQEIGSGCYQWAVQALKAKAQLALRAIQGVVRLKQQYPADVINVACERALKLGSTRYATVKLLCEDQETLVPTTNRAPLELLQEHELIRSLAEYQNHLDHLSASQS